ncbi:DUF6366 family protein [Alkalihalobacillus sp. LMS6]|uniref:DUF6366 family protein n=1 Tax=Alkalihalobacillus sp. LMS6 TaxID=2924034 RepID=UPI0020D16945|nr:DUF6366 family protein [Alkalihalobacillus sp. LMS6]UTR06676.1 DUF6366 family protein [Alkalihalobacillus sp. LMS6]
MSNEKQSPEQKREKLRQQEQKRNPTGNLKDAYDRGYGGGLADLVGMFGWKTTGIVFSVIVIILLGILVFT